eukprot:TRINITY_DN4920_c0_g1_i2.p2 TRINITY_DN4920_c0_g1~~TRINITY_DN4920_c0_g1_i2.p2  ORF type:complete len:112 (-),score=17.01 TRINITY_DN4920_c0_g1_i2:64-399(-)
MTTATVGGAMPGVLGTVVAGLQAVGAAGLSAATTALLGIGGGAVGGATGATVASKLQGDDKNTASESKQVTDEGKDVAAPPSEREPAVHDVTTVSFLDTGSPIDNFAFFLT